MKFSLKRKDIAADSLEIERSALSGFVQVKIDGRPLARLKEKNGPFEVEMKDRSKRKLFVRSRWLDPVPAVFLGDEELLLAEKLRFIDYLFGCFPVLMFLPYGPLPTVIAFILLLLNFRILRTKTQATLKWAAIYALDISLFWLLLALVKFVGSAH
ncbi:MAG: hypothetical protein K2X27_08665 [Candidatus Obscuribacterales bacterium]|nr:hypothetical protein [Candidatus Obscuribacterales bacterium]